MSSTPVRLRPAPACDPPYDDERHSDPADALLQPPLELGPQPPSRQRVRRGRAARGTPPGSSDAAPPDRAAAAWFVNACVEIVNGLRPVGHVRALSRPLEASEVLESMTHATRRLQRLIRRATAGGRNAATSREDRVRLHRMRTCQPRPGVLEIAAVIGTSRQSWAAAFRLERRHGRWQCVAATVL